MDRVGSWIATHKIDLPCLGHGQQRCSGRERMKIKLDQDQNSTAAKEGEENSQMKQTMACIAVFVVDREQMKRWEWT